MFVRERERERESVCVCGRATLGSEGVRSLETRSKQFVFHLHLEDNHSNGRRNVLEQWTHRTLRNVFALLLPLSLLARGIRHARSHDRF